MSLRGKLSRLESAPYPRAPDTAALESSLAVASAARHTLLDDLRARIQTALERSGRRMPNPSTDVQSPAESVEPFDLPFVAEATARGPLHIRARRLPFGHRTGRAPVAGGWDASADVLALLALDPKLAACDPRKA